MSYNDDNEAAARTLHHASFEELARASQGMDIFPSLKHLDLAISSLSSAQMVLIFLRKDLPRLTLAITSDYSPPYSQPDSLRDSDDGLGHPVDRFFVEVSRKAPNLTTLNLDLASINIPDSQLIRYLASFHSLQKLSMHPANYTSKMFTALATFPNLRTIEFEGIPTPLEFMTQRSRFRPKLQEGAFPELRELVLNATFNDISNFFSHKYAPTKSLSRLHITCRPLETLESLTACLNILVNSCRSLESLWFDMSLSMAETRISYQQLLILRSLPNLKSFKFNHSYPASLTNEELGELVSSWDTLETLYLTATNVPSPISSDQSHLTLACLLPLAQYCPKLRELGLYMDAMAPVTLPPTFKPFTQLEVLEVGASPIQDPYEVSTFLIALCPTGFDLRLDAAVHFWRHSLDVHHSNRAIYLIQWDQVSDDILAVKSGGQKKIKQYLRSRTYSDSSQQSSGDGYY